MWLSYCLGTGHWVFTDQQQEKDKTFLTPRSSHLNKYHWICTPLIWDSSSLSLKLLTSKQERETLSVNVLPVSSQLLKQQSQLNDYQNKAKENETAPSFLWTCFPPSSVISYRGMQPSWTTDRWRGFLLKPAISSPTPPPHLRFCEAPTGCLNSRAQLLQPVA